MLHALLHGKLDLELPGPHRREDALTSSVFGTLRMVEAWDVLANWLEVEPLSSEQEDTVACWFWPRLAGAVEPDVVLRFGDTLVVVEAKYRSGRHDLSLDEADERPSDQIERQYNAVSLPPEARHVYPEGLERAVRERRRLAQVFVVDARRLRLARKEYKESRACLPQGARLTLATWQALDKLLSSPPCSRSRWASDLRSYLRLCGLSSFHGVPIDYLKRSGSGSSNVGVRVVVEASRSGSETQPRRSRLRPGLRICVGVRVVVEASRSGSETQPRR